MPTNPATAALSAKERALRDEAALLAWRQCLTENGLQGAIGCAHLAWDAADAFMEQRRQRIGRQP